MEVIKSRCDQCFYNNLVDGLYDNQKPKPSGKYIGDTYVQNPELTEWINKRKLIRESLPEVWCIIGDDDYMTTVCLDCLGLQRKDGDV
jgi:hypothetical protein